MLHDKVADQINKMPRVLTNNETKRITRINSPVMGPRTPLTWRVRQYVYDRGGAFELSLLDFSVSLPVAASAVDHFIIPSNHGSMIDADYEQYQNKLYSVRMTADQDLSVPIQISYSEQIVIIIEHGGVETEVYTTGTDDNVNRRLLISLDFGSTDVYVLTYADNADRRLEIAVDLTRVRSCLTPIGNAGFASSGILYKTITLTVVIPTVTINAVVNSDPGDNSETDTISVAIPSLSIVAAVNSDPGDNSETDAMSVAIPSVSVSGVVIP